MDCSPPGSFVHGILQARILEWVAISFSKGSSPPRDRTHVFCLAGGFFTTEQPFPVSPVGGPLISHLSITDTVLFVFFNKSNTCCNPQPAGWPAATAVLRTMLEAFAPRRLESCPLGLGRDPHHNPLFLSGSRSLLVISNYHEKKMPRGFDETEKTN